MDIQEQIDKAAVKAFAADLAGMSKEALQRALDDVTETIDRDTAWQEALSARLRQLEKKGSDTQA